MSNYNQCLSINGYEPGLAAKNCGFPQGFALGHLLFLLYINDLNQVIKISKAHRFADDIYQWLNQKTEQTNQCWLKHLA